MGMGLAVSQTIIQRHGGRLWAAPNAPRGATFRFRLPTGSESG
jgi:signal transduction histidine kinase